MPLISRQTHSEASKVRTHCEAWSHSVHQLTHGQDVDPNCDGGARAIADYLGLEKVTVNYAVAVSPYTTLTNQVAGL